MVSNIVSAQSICAIYKYLQDEIYSELWWYHILLKVYGRYVTQYINEIPFLANLISNFAVEYQNSFNIAIHQPQCRFYTPRVLFPYIFGVI